MMTVLWICCKSVSNGYMVVKSCVKIGAIENMEKQREQTIELILWRDSDKTTKQHRQVQYKEKIDMSNEEPICWMFDTKEISTISAIPQHAKQMTMAMIMNGAVHTPVLTVEFPFNTTSVFQSYKARPFNGIAGTITFDIFHAFSLVLHRVLVSSLLVYPLFFFVLYKKKKGSNYVTISNRNYMMHHNCFKLWSLCAEQGAQGHRLQCINNAVITTSPANGETLLNELHSQSYNLN
ncbi:hypothetical protein RFI_18984 [Reticulomyxa filosa]|uniref:Uncharacterized protein n=1 Tax=Reticulomyxa filosa TaxID=46433 RepID=X6MWB1_RETFI|nr:hypothetical protein RFI_18984 [Reticulomyxa filosa]|eukprot:ETO18293.1 hypothetical protein RFI_18984 [Reticulomyxa filosa]